MRFTDFIYFLIFLHNNDTTEQKIDNKSPQLFRRKFSDFPNQSLMK